jgi:hypothetical protein
MAFDPTKKYILCRPQGGLNDMLCQIELCCRYAEKFDRIVVVDTAYEHSHSFWDSLSNYFVSKCDLLVLDARPYLPHFSNASFFPAMGPDEIDTYQTTWNNEHLLYARSDKPQSSAPCFDFEQDYHEQVLLHAQCGGNDMSHDICQRMHLNEKLAEMLMDRFRTIDGGFHAVHVRHTDMQSNYAEAIEHFKLQNVEKLFVASDNRQVIEDFRTAFGAQKIFSFAKLPERAGQIVHHDRSAKRPRFETNRDAILDLFTLAFGVSLFVCRTTNNKYGELSGFSSLAKHLHENKKKLQAFLM